MITKAASAAFRCNSYAFRRECGWPPVNGVYTNLAGCDLHA